MRRQGSIRCTGPAQRVAQGKRDGVGGVKPGLNHALLVFLGLELAWIHADGAVGLFVVVCCVQGLDMPHSNYTSSLILVARASADESCVW